MRRTWGIALAAALVCGCSGGSSGSGGSGGEESFDAAQPVGVVEAAGKVWTVEAGGNEITGRATASDTPVHVPVGAAPLRAVYDGHLLWVSVFGADRVVALDPATATVVRRIRVPGQPEGLVSAFGAVWVVRQQAGKLTRVTDAETGPSYRLGAEPRLVAANDTALFASNFGDGTVSRVDPATEKSTTSGRLCNGAQDMAVADDVVWVACTPDDKVVAVDATTLQPLGEVSVEGEPDALHVDGPHLYVVTTAGPTIVELSNDPRHPAVLHRKALGAAAPLFDQANVDAAVVDGTWWVTSPGESKVYVHPL